MTRPTLPKRPMALEGPLADNPRSGNQKWDHLAPDFNLHQWEDDHPDFAAIARSQTLIRQLETRMVELGTDYYLDKACGRWVVRLLSLEKEHAQAYSRAAWIEANPEAYAVEQAALQAIQDV